MRSTLAQQIRNARNAAGLTQAQLGKRLGLKGRAVYRWERDDSSPTQRHRRELVQVIRAVNPRAGIVLEEAIVSARKNIDKGTPAASDCVSAVAPPALDPHAALESAVYQAADELEVPARQLRGALARLFARLRQANLTLESIEQSLGRQITERLRGPTPGTD